jgi:hypothetical protein
VSLKDVIVYVYPTVDARQAEVTVEVKILQSQIPRDIDREFLNWPDWSWAKDYKITVVDRTR